MVLGVYTCSMETIYLSLRPQVAVGTFLMKSPVLPLSPVSNLYKGCWLLFDNSNFLSLSFIKVVHVGYCLRIVITLPVFILYKGSSCWLLFDNSYNTSCLYPL